MQATSVISNLFLLGFFLVSVWFVIGAYGYKRSVKAWVKKNEEDRLRAIEMSKDPERLQEALDLWSEIARRPPPTP